uniref:40S ribosomal protein S15 n=1 Tax=Catagonus wagneri TaxID=51154 RepID=A0A8C3VNW8_9CETA
MDVYIQQPATESDLWRKPTSLLNRLRKARKAVPHMEEPKVMKIHLWDIIILTQMVRVYNCKIFNQEKIKPGIIRHYVGKFSNNYKPVKHEPPRPASGPPTPPASYTSKSLLGQ